MADKVFVPRPSKWLFTPERVERDNNWLGGQLDNVGKVDPGHPFRRKYLGIHDAVLDSQVIFMHLGVEIDDVQSVMSASSRKSSILQDLALWHERNGQIWRKGTIKLAVLALMCESVGRDRSLDEAEADGHAYLAKHAEDYDGLPHPLSYLPRPFVGSEAFVEVEAVIAETVKDARTYLPKE